MRWLVLLLICGFLYGAGFSFWEAFRPERTPWQLLGWIVVGLACLAGMFESIGRLRSYLRPRTTRRAPGTRDPR